MSRKKVVVEEEAPNPLRQYVGTKEQRIYDLAHSCSGCTACGLSEFREMANKARRQDAQPIDVVFGDGMPSTADILIVGEFPGKEETAYNIPFVGSSGALLNQLIAMTADDQTIKEEFYTFNRMARKSQKQEAEFMQKMIDYRGKHFYLTNAVGCQTPENRTPLRHELDACWERLWNIIYIIDPIIIIACGNTALSAVTRRAKTAISQERGTIIDVKYKGQLGELRYPVMPIYHPSHLLRIADWKSPNGDWKKTIKDFRAAIDVVDKVREQDFGIPIPDRVPHGL